MTTAGEVAEIISAVLTKGELAEIEGLVNNGSTGDINTRMTELIHAAQERMGIAKMPCKDCVNPCFNLSFIDPEELEKCFCPDMLP